MKALLTAVVVLLLGGWAQNGNEAVERIDIDIVWVAASRQNRGWVITSAPPALTTGNKRTLRTGDILLSIDGHDLAELGPLAVARMLDDVPQREVPMKFVREDKTYEMRVFGEGVVTDGRRIPSPTYSSHDLQKRGQAAPAFSLLDLHGQKHTLDSERGKWVLLNFWGTWCSGCMQEIPALDDLSINYKSKLEVISIAMNDSPETLKKFLASQPLSYPILLGGTFDDRFAKEYNVHAAPTNLVIAPDGQVRFVGVGPMSLKGAVQSIMSGRRRQ